MGIKLIMVGLAQHFQNAHGRALTRHPQWLLVGNSQGRAFVDELRRSGWAIRQSVHLCRYRCLEPVSSRGSRSHRNGELAPNMRGFEVAHRFCCCAQRIGAVDDRCEFAVLNEVFQVFDILAASRRGQRPQGLAG